MNEKLLTRIAESLEAINGSLYEISVGLDDLNLKLDGCISKNGKNNFLCVTGNISTY